MRVIRRKNQLQRAVLPTLALAALTLVQAAASVPAGWVSFRNGPANQGRSAVLLRAPDTHGSVTTFETGGLIWGTAVIDADGNTYVGAANKRFYKLDAHGRELWHYDLLDRPDALIDSAAALAPHNLVVVPGGDGCLHALDRTTGRLAWRFEAHHVTAAEQRHGAVVNSFEGNVQVGPDGTIYAGSDNGALYAVDPASGRERWSYRTGLMVWSSPACDPAGRWIAFGSLDGYFYLLDPHDGHLLDRFDAGSEVKASPAIDRDGRLVFGTSQGRVWALEVVNFHLVPAWHADAGAEIYASAAVLNDGVVVGALDGSIRKLDRAGRLRWVYLTGSRVASSAVVSADGVVLVGARNGKLYALDAGDGRRLWSYATADAPRKANLDASPALGPDGTIMVGAYSGRVTRLPAGYALAHRTDPRVAVGGLEDQPDDGPTLGSNRATVRYQDRGGRLLAGPALPVGCAPILRLKLVAREGDRRLGEIAINPTPHVHLTPEAPLEVVLASDGRSMNVLPKGLLAPNTHYTLKTDGSYRLRDQAWWVDRLVPRSHGTFAASLGFDTGPAGHLEAPHVGTTWGGKGFYLFQPEALETYTPAALDGQAFELVACGFTAGSTHDTGVLLGLPALPVPGGVRLLAEPSRVFVLAGQLAGGTLRGDGSFTLSAMGGTIPFERLTISAHLRADGRLDEGELLAAAPLWGIRGSGSSFAFPASLLNDVADHALHMVGEGTFDGSAVVGEPVRILLDRPAVPGDETHVPLDLTPAPTARLVTAVASREGRPLALGSLRIEAGAQPPPGIDLRRQGTGPADHIQVFLAVEP